MNFDNKQLAVCVLCAVFALGCGDAASGDAFAGQGGQAGGDSGSSSDATSANGSTSSASSGSSSSGGSVGNMLSVKRYGDGLGQHARAVAHFPNGDIAVVGSFYGTVDFGGGAAETSQGKQDIFVVRYTPEGSHVWTRALGNKWDDSDDGFDVAIDPVGDVIVVGHADDYSGYPEGWCQLNACTGGIVIGKLNGTTGAPMWGRVGQSRANARGVAVDAKGNVLVTGDFDSWPAEEIFGNMIDGSNVSNNPVKGFIAKYSPDGDPLWSRQLAHNDGAVVGQAVAVHGSRVYVTGHFEGTGYFGGTTLNSAGARDVFLAKYGENGEHLASVAFGGVGNDEGLGVVVSQLSGDVVLTGTFEDSIDFGGGALESAGLKDGFVVKLGADGAQLWSRRFGGPVEDGGLAVTVDAHERVYFCGYYQHVVDLGQGPLKSQGVGDILVAKLEPTGETMWAHSFGGSAWDEGAGLSLGEDKNLTVVGSFQGSAAFGATDLNSAGSADVFVLQLGP